jgi:hypothetical protein
VRRERKKRDILSPVNVLYQKPIYQKALLKAILFLKKMFDDAKNTFPPKHCQNNILSAFSITIVSGFCSVKYKLSKKFSIDQKYFSSFDEACGMVLS